MKPMGPHCEISPICLPRHPAVAYLYLVREMKSSTVLSYFSSLESLRPRSREILTAYYPIASSEYELRSMDKQALVPE